MTSPDRTAREPRVSTSYLQYRVEHAIGIDHVDDAYLDLRDCRAQLEAATARAEKAEREASRLDRLINMPHTDEWLGAVKLEAAHQRERYAPDHDAGKTPFDWFWLIGFLAQKAASAQVTGDEKKARHHTISTGAVLLNWFRHIEAGASPTGTGPR